MIIQELVYSPVSQRIKQTLKFHGHKKKAGDGHGALQVDDFVRSFGHNVDNESVGSLYIFRVLDKVEAALRFEQADLDGSAGHNQARRQWLLHRTLVQCILANLAQFAADKDFSTGSRLDLNDTIAVGLCRHVDFTKLQWRNYLQRNQTKVEIPLPSSTVLKAYL